MNKYIATHLSNYTKPKIIYDLNILRENLAFIQEAANTNNINILFAVKSFPVATVLDFVSSYVDGFEISNTSEYKLLPANNSYKFISVNDPTIKLSEIPTYLSQKNKTVLYNLDCLDECITEELRIYNDTNLQFGLRLSHTALGITSPSYHTGVINSRFGIGLQKAQELFATKPFISGIHLHNGSETNNIESYIFMANKIVAFLEKNSIEINYINFGGGLHRLSNNEILILFMELKNTIPKKWKLFFEPGHLFGKNTGYAITKIASVKEIDTGKYVVTTDISYECNLKWSTPQYSPRCKELSGEYVDITFYGASCSERDFILNCRIDINDFRQNIIRDHLVIFENINGYAVAWNHSFNGILKAETYFYDSAQHATNY